MSDSNDLSSKMSGLNVNATEFVPAFLAKPPATQAQQVPPANTDSNHSLAPSPPAVSAEQSSSAAAAMDTSTPSPSNSTGPSTPAKTAGGASGGPAESWEDAADHSTASGCSSSGMATTPDEEDNSMDTDGGGGASSGHRSHKVPASKPKTKVKPPKEEETMTKKEHVNMVFIGHVDAGKSTIGGQIMKLTGMVDARTLEKYEREAKEKNRESWYLSWCMDTNLEEREKGKTVEVGRAYFETDSKHFTILDAPGHKGFVPNMIGGASQADLAVLVISARKGEFETGFERGGQTNEHTKLVKTAGVKHLIVLVNKMDDPTVKWAEERYNFCKDRLIKFLKSVGFNPQKDVKFMPVSGLTGAGILDPVGSVAPWHDPMALPFIPYVDSLPLFKRNTDGPFMMPIVDKYSDMGTVVMGKVESGECTKGQTLAIYPNRTEVKVDTLWSDDFEVTKVVCGESVKVKLKGVEEGDVSPGFVLCYPSCPVKSCRVFDAQVMVLEYKSIICPGKTFVLHLQAIIEEVTLKALICLVDRKTGEKSKTRPRFIKQDQAAIARFVSDDVICMERFKDHPQLGRFMLRDEDKTVAVGKVLKLVE